MFTGTRDPASGSLLGILVLHLQTTQVRGISFFLKLLLAD